MTLLRSVEEVAANLLDPPASGLNVDPVRWVRERLRAEPWSVEAEILEAIRDHGEVAVQSCHNIGKDWTAAAAACWWLDVHKPGSAFVVSTAPTGHQVKAILWRYIGRMHRAGGLPGRVNLSEWYIGPELVGFGRKPAEYTPEAFQGIHAPHVLVVLDEASGIPGSLWEASSSLTSNEGSRTLAIGNPDRTGSEFWRVCQPGSGWRVIQVGFERTPNFTGERIAPELAAELISPGWVESRRARWGEESPLFMAKCRGLFPDDADDGVVPASKLAVCRQEREVPLPDDGSVQLGVDVGASETGDQTVIRERRGRKAGRVWRLRTGDSMRIVGEVVNAVRESGATLVAVDVIGVGFGVAGRLTEVLAELPELKCTVVGVNVGEAAKQPTRFVRLRSELWWEIGRELTVEAGWDLSGIDDDTAADLTAPRYTLDSSGRVKVESKDDVRARLGRSTDDADALLLAFYEASSPGQVADSSMYERPLGW